MAADSSTRCARSEQAIACPSCGKKIPLKALEAQRTSKRRTLFDAQDQIDQRREVLIQGIEAKLAPKTHLEPLMAIRWALR